LVARRGDLSDLSALLSGHQWRWHRRSAGDNCPSAPHCRARRGCDLDIALLHVADAGLRLRRLKLCRCRPDLRDARRLRCADRRGPPARSPGDDRPRAVTYLRPAPLVRRKPLQRSNAKADWYVWADSKPDGTPPNNWLSIFGGSAWQWDPTRLQYYLHNFLTSQPDLNLHNPQVQEALLAVERFWLERGVDGFRLDTINFYFHDRELRDNPALVPERRNASTAPAVNPYNYQEHIYDKNRPENLEFLKRFRAVMDEFPAIAAVGEVGDSQRGLEIAGEYTSGGDKVHMCYAFEFLAPDRLTPQRVAEVLRDFHRAAPEGWACWAFSNHDVVRHVSRWADGVTDHDAHAKLLASLLMSLRGTVCIYQGEELALAEAELDYEDLQDPYGIQFWPDFKGRDGCRTPMVWESLPDGGFSSATPWLPISQSHIPRAVAVQEGDPASVLHHYRRFLAFRKANPALAKGEIEFVETRGSLLGFLRSHGNEKVFCLFNMSDEAATKELPMKRLEPLEGHGFVSEILDHEVKLPAWGAFFARLA
jgi:alpha-glucosidase